MTFVSQSILARPLVTSTVADRVSMVPGGLTGLPPAGCANLSRSGGDRPVALLERWRRDLGMSRLWAAKCALALGLTLQLGAGSALAEDTTAPGLVSATAQARVGSEWVLLLTYNEPLDSTSIPATGDFVVNVDGNPVAVSGLTLESDPAYAIAHVILQVTRCCLEFNDQAVTVSYAAGTNPIQDTAGNDAPSFANRAAVVQGFRRERKPTEPAALGGVPVANAGEPSWREVDPGVSVTLDGSGSSDPDGDSLTFRWAQQPIIGQVKNGRGEDVDNLDMVALTGADTATATFVAPVKPGVVHFVLTVSDPTGRADADEVVVEVRDLEISDSTAPRENSPATGAPAIAGAVRVGETLEASTDGIEDADGLSGAAFAFQWLRADAEIGGATEPSYTLAASDEGSAIKVRVTFTDDAGNEETLTSAATEAVAPALPPLTASFHDVPSEHDGESEFSFELRFSEDLAPMSSATLRDQALSATNATVTRAKRVVKRETRLWTITVQPHSPEAVTVSLAAPTDCAAEGALCTPDGRPLSNAPTATVAAAAARAALTASFHDVPSEHGGPESEFSFELRFSEDFGGRLPYTKIRDEALTATNGRVRGAKRVAPNQNQRWTITVRAHSSEPVTVSLAATSDCAAAGAICTPDGRPLSNSFSATVAGPPREPLTADFRRVPAEHDGTTFTFRVKFSEDVEVTPRVLRETAFEVTGGSVRRAPRFNGRDDLREIHVEPSGYGAVTIALPATADCGAAGAICTSDGRPLSNANQATVIGPVGISVADARVKEGEGAVLAFAVTLSRAASAALTVDYATSDGSARAGEDYRAASGTLSFQAGESSATVEVAVLDDAHDEGEETLTLRLSNASGAHVADGEATGTIENADLMPAALLARFGRATAEQVVEHIEERMAAPRRRGFTARLAGRELQPGNERDFALGLVSSFAPTGGGLSGAAPLGGAARAATGSHLDLVFGADTSGMGGRTDATGMMGRRPPADGARGDGLFGALSPGADLLSSSGFELNRASHGGMLSLWSRSSRSYFTGMEEALSLNGDVRTTMFGADWARGPLTMGLSVGHTRGLGGYAGASGGAMTTAMTGFYPWVGYQVNDRVSVWAVTGYGKGALTLTPDGAGELETGMSMAMTAVGTRGELLGSRATGGFGLAFKADALWVGATTELLDGSTGRLNASEAGVTRMRTALEGSRGFTLGGGRLSLRPTVEVGLRRDGGDAETGAGLDLGGGLAVADAAMGLSLDVRVRTLLVHQAEKFAERGLSVSFGWNPTPSSPFGLSARLAPSWGGSAMGGAEALWNGQMAYGPGSPGALGSGAQLNAEVGYGLPVGARFVGTPRVGLRRSAYGREYRAGWGLGVLDTSLLHFDLGLEAQRREAPTQGGASNGLLARATVSW